MAPFDGSACDAAGNPLQALRKVIDKDESLTRDRYKSQLNFNLENIIAQNVLLLNQRVRREMDIFMDQKPVVEITSVTCDSSSSTWARDYKSFEKSAVTDSPSVGEQLGPAPTEIHSEASVYKTEPSKTLYIFEDPLHGQTVTMLPPSKYGQYTVVRGWRRFASSGTGSRNQPLQSDRTVTGQERIIDYINKRIFPCSAIWVRSVEPSQYGIDVQIMLVLETGKYERPESSDELMILADRHAYRDDLAPVPENDSSTTREGCPPNPSCEPGHQDFQRHLLRCHKDLLCAKSTFFRDLVSQNSKLETVVLNEEPEEVIIEMINFLELGHLRTFQYVATCDGSRIHLKGNLQYARFYVDMFAAGIKYGIPDLTSAAYDVLNSEDIHIKGPNLVLGEYWEPTIKLVLGDIYKLEAEIGPPATRLKEMFLRRHASKIMQLRKCYDLCKAEGCEGGHCISELVELRYRFPAFHKDLYTALEQVKGKFEEVVEDFKGDWTIRYVEQESTLRERL